MQTRIYVDFNTMMMDEQARVYISADGDQDKVQGLHSGLLVTLYDEELEVEATVELAASSSGRRVWLAKPDWSTRRDLPQTALSVNE